MPHFVIDCSRNVLDLHDEATVIACVLTAASDSGLFALDDIKVRVNPYLTYTVGGTREDFVHVFASIMQGRSVAQRAGLSRRIVTSLSVLFPRVRNVAVSVAQFEQATYCNRAMI